MLVKGTYFWKNTYSRIVTHKLATKDLTHGHKGGDVYTLGLYWWIQFHVQLVTLDDEGLSAIRQEKAWRLQARPPPPLVSQSADNQTKRQTYTFFFIEFGRYLKTIHYIFYFPYFVMQLDEILKNDKRFFTRGCRSYLKTDLLETVFCATSKVGWRLASLSIFKRRPENCWPTPEPSKHAIMTLTILFWLETKLCATIQQKKLWSVNMTSVHQ